MIATEQESILQLASDLELRGTPSQLCQYAASWLRRLAPLVESYSIVQEGERFRVIGPRLGCGWTFERYSDAVYVLNNFRWEAAATGRGNED